MRKKIYILLSILILSGCTTSIKKIVENPQKYHKKSVKVKGKVVNSLLLDDIMMFTIKDHSGELIDVVTKSFLPVKGDIVKVRGQVVNNYKYSRRKLLVIKEKEMRTVAKFDTAYNEGEDEKYKYRYINKRLINK
jgi:aspartyl/asparaginyl-tRNA synthetase